MHSTFKKNERLCSKKLIGDISNKGQSFFEYPFKVVWMETESLSTRKPVQVAFAVSKKKLGTAILRNTIRRRMREAWRKNKYLLYEVLEKKEKQIAVMLIYIPAAESEYTLIEEKIILSLQRLKSIMT